MKKLFLLLLFFGFCESAQAADIYYAQSATGGNTGANCANARALSSHVIGDDVAGNILHFCGTITGGANSTLLTILANGSVGNPITIKWENGAIVQAPYFSFNGGINISGRSYIVIDGGTNGILQNTANGTNLANQIDASIGIKGDSCNNCEVRNLTIANIYVHVAPTPEPSFEHSQVAAIWLAGSNWKIHDNVIHDCGWCIHNFWHAGDANVEIGPNNYIYNMDHGGATAGVSGNASGFTVHDNHFGSMVNWDTSNGQYHHDGWHGFQAGTGQNTGMLIYNNLFDGNPGANLTSQGIYFERQDSAIASIGLRIFNNVIDGSLEPSGSFGEISIGDLVDTVIANNTIIGVNRDSAPCLIINAGTTTVKNNIMTGCWTGTWFPYNNAPNKVYNNNTYANLGACGLAYSVDANCHTTLANWQSFSGQDANSQLIATANLGTGYVPASTSLAINAATNLTSLGITALNSDKNGSARPPTGSWTAGALNGASSGTAQAVLTPSSNNYGNVVQHVTSSPVTFTLTNPSGTANLILSTPCCSTSGTNGPDFVISAKTCTDGQVLRPALDSCTISVTFTPNIVGAESGVLHTGGNASANATLTGTGTAPATAAVNITPNPVPFPNQNIGSTSSPATVVTVTNTGLANLVLNNPTYFTISPSGEFVVTGGTCGPGSTIPPNTQCTILATFTPSAAGARQATLSVLGNASGSATLNGTGVAVGSPSLTVTPTTFNFGNVVKGTTSTLQNFTITNVGTANATMGNPFFSFVGGSNPADFSRVSPGGSDCVPGQPLAPSATCLISVAFTPSTAAFESGGLNILSDAATVSSSLSGTGTFPVVTITPVSPIAFGSINQGSPSAPKTLTIKNTGTATLTGITLSVTGATAAYFTIPSNNCTSLAINATCTASVVFTPGSAGNFTDTFNVNGNATGSATLTGTGVALAPVILLFPRPVLFPSVPTGVTSAQVTVTVSNTGTAVQSGLNFTITTGDFIDFTKVGGNCGTTLAAGGTCTYIFTFKPSGAPRAESTLLTVGGTVSANVAMNGTGTASGGGGAPVPIVIATQIDLFPLPRITITGKYFVAGTTQITIDGTPQSTVCSSVASCTTTLAGSTVLLPGFGVIGYAIGVK